ncbi:MAG: hypothetical protein ACRD0W_07580 [Acidimicrobiales bacterium]
MTAAIPFEYADDAGVTYVAGEEGGGSPVKIGLARSPAHARSRSSSSRRASTGG